MQQSIRSELVTKEIVDGTILIISLVRPKKLNALTPQMLIYLRIAFEQLENDENLWVGVLRAEGDHFTAGLDFTTFITDIQSGTANPDSMGVDPFSIHSQTTKPIVTAVQGVTYTAGLEMALAGDIVVASETTRFSQMEPSRGLMAGAGGIFRLIDRCGWGNAMYHLLTADEFDVHEAYRIGIVQEITPPGRETERALEIARTIAKNSPLATQATKRNALIFMADGQKAAIDDMETEQLRLSNSDDAVEGLRSFRERRPPNFSTR